MGKKQGQAQRTKGNAQPSSSAKAAEMLQQVSLSAGYSFSSEIQPIGIGTLIEDSYDSNLDPDFRVVLKKLSKKDSLTKSKALDELKTLIETKSSEECLLILPYWSKSYTKLTLDNDRKIREQCQLNHGILCSKMTKNLAPHLKTIMPYWLIAQSDSHLPTSRLAEQSFIATFIETKRPEVVFFARDEILNVLFDYLIVQTHKTLSDMKSTSEDEALQKYELVICICMRGLNLFLQYLLITLTKEAAALMSLNSSFEKLEKIFTDVKFWKYARDHSLKIRGEFFQLLSSLMDTIVLNEKFSNSELDTFRQNLKQKLIPLVFYSCEEDNSACSYYVWQSILKCIQKLDANFWSLLNVKKTFLPKLIGLLRSHANDKANSQNFEIVFTSLLPLISKLTPVFDDLKEKLQFYKDLFAKINDAIGKESTSALKTRQYAATVNKTKIIDSLFDCAVFVINELSKQNELEANEFIHLIITNYILQIVSSYLKSKSESSELESKFIKFINEIESHVEIKQYFWSNLNSIVLDKFKISDLEQSIEKQIDEANENLTILKRFSAIFKIHWSNSNQSINLLNLIKIVFSQFLNKFTTVLKSENFLLDDQYEQLAFIYLNGINTICLNFMHESLLSSFVANFTDQSISNTSDLNSSFNDKVIESLIQLTNKRTNNTILFGIIDLYLITNANQTNLNSKLDHYLLKETNLIQIDSLFNYYFKLKSLNDHPVIKTKLFEWFTQSEKLSDILTDHYFKQLDNRFSLTLEFITFLLGTNSKLDKVNEFYNSIVKSIINLTNKYLHDSSMRTKLNDLVSFSLKVLFNPVKTISDQSNLWTILINFFKLKSQNSLVDTDLNNLIDKLANKLFDLIYEKASLNDSNIFKQINDYDQLILFIINNVLNDNLNDYFQNEIILMDLIGQFAKTLTLKTNGFEHFYSDVLFRSEFGGSNLLSFDQLFKSLLLLDNQKFNIDLLKKFYLDDNINYIYSDNYHLILESEQNKTFNGFNLALLKQLSYSLKILNLYFKLKGTESSLLITTLMQQQLTTSLTSNPNWWLYLILSAILVNKLEANSLLDLDKNYVLSMKLIDDIKSGLNELLFGTNFLKLILSNLNLEEFGTLIENNDQSELELNNLSLFLFELVDYNSENGLHRDLSYELNSFAYKLYNRLIRTSSLDSVKIKYYLYDIPFAKYSIVENMKDLDEKTLHYYDLYNLLIEKHSTDLIKIAQIKDYHNDLLNLEEFNFNLSILIKYLRFYLNYLCKSQVFNSNEITAQFISDKLSKHLVQILDLFQTKDISNKPGQFFYYEFNTKSDSVQLKWQQFVHLDNLNSFLKLFFIDYKLTNNNYQQQLSQYLNEKQWDFILCYSAALIQYLNKNSSELSQSSNEIELFSVHFLRFLNSLIKTIQVRVRDNLCGTYPNQIWNDWNGFFSKEIFDPSLSLYVKLAEFYSEKYQLINSKQKTSAYLFNLSLKTTKIQLIKSLSSLVSKIPFERLIVNELEPKFNVLDLSLDVQRQNKSSIHLTDQLKTVFNHLVPNLKHEMRSIQLSTYKILSKVMSNICVYYDLKSNDTESELDDSESDIKQLNIFESLPHVIKDHLFELSDLFSNLKNSIQFEQNILVTKVDDEDEETDSTNKKIKLKEICHDVNKKLMSFLLINRLILDMFSTDNLEFKVKLVSDLREINFNDYLMHCLFRLMPSFKYSSQRLFTSYSNQDDLNELISNEIQSDEFLNLTHILSNNLELVNESFLNESVQVFSCRLYKHALKCVPAMIRDWWNIQSRRIADIVEKYTAKFVSPILLEEEIIEINRSANLINDKPVEVAVVDTTKKKFPIEDDEQSTIRIRGMLSTREIVSTYKMKELNMELIIQLPLNYPLGVVDVSSVRRLGVTENEWRNWLIQLTTYLTHQNGSIIQSLQIWKRNVDKKFSGVEECTICYNVIHGTNYQLPKKKCRTCKKLFHSICLYKWFESSSKSTCPLCRNLF